MELTRLAEEVREAEVALDDGELTLIALIGLDASYDAFVTAQMARANDITFAAFQGLLQAHEERYSHPAMMQCQWPTPCPPNLLFAKFV